MKTPAFWREETMHGRLLAPLGWIYYGFSNLHRKWQSFRAKPQKLSAPVICIGNVTAGGAGKTPTARMLSGMLKIAGQEPHCISRGYGGEKQKTPLRVDSQKHQATQVGDEPLLLAQTCPTWISTNRQASTQAALKEGASIIIADDGLQNPTFHKDISLLIMDSHYGVGNGQFVPSGPLREPLTKALKRCDGIILIGDGTYQPPTDLPVWKSTLNTVTDLSQYKTKPAFAFTGLATPHKFFDSLRKQGVNLLGEIAYSDHHNYTPTDIALLLEKSEEEQAALLTTAKDYVKLPESFREKVKVVDVKLTLDQPKEFMTWLEKQIVNE